MNFKPELCALVLSGVKTVTRRPVNGKTGCAYKPGKDYAVCPGRGRKQLGRIVVESVTVGPVGAITDAEARLEGFADREAFTAYWCKLYVGPLDLSVPVYRIEFRLLSKGDSDA